MDTSYTLPLRIITGASSNHSKSLHQLLQSIHRIHSPNQYELILWDLGLTNKERIAIEYFYGNMRTFDYSKYPAYFDINVNAGEYAWKPALIYETVTELGPGTYIWLDAGDVVMKPLIQVQAYIEKYGIYSPDSSMNIDTFTHAKVFEAVHPKYEAYKKSQMRNGAILGFDTRRGWVQELVRTFAEWARKQEIIAPTGSSRENHRQDQAIFSLLYWDAERIHRFDTSAHFRSFIKLHQDID